MNNNKLLLKRPVFNSASCPSATLVGRRVRGSLLHSESVHLATGSTLQWCGVFSYPWIRTGKYLFFCLFLFLCKESHVSSWWSKLKELWVIEILCYLEAHRLVYHSFRHVCRRYETPGSQFVVLHVCVSTLLPAAPNPTREIWSPHSNRDTQIFLKCQLKPKANARNTERPWRISSTISTLCFYTILTSGRFFHKSVWWFHEFQSWSRKTIWPVDGGNTQ